LSSFSFLEIDGFFLFLDVEVYRVLNKVKLKGGISPFYIEDNVKRVLQVLWFALVEDL